MTRWDKIFIASSLVFLFGVIVFLLGEHLIPGWSQVTVPFGGLLMGMSGVSAGVSGIILILSAAKPQP